MEPLRHETVEGITKAVPSEILFELLFNVPTEWRSTERQKCSDSIRVEHRTNVFKWSSQWRGERLAIELLFNVSMGR